MNRFSSDAADRLIRELIETKRAATSAEIGQIIGRMATAPFDPRDRSVPSELRGATFRGRRLGGRGPSLSVHLAERILLNKQWANGTTEDEYAADLQRAVRDPRARLVVYARRGGHMAGILVPTNVPESRRGQDALPWLYVVYSADRGTIVSGYQASSRQALTIPEDARWLT